MAEAAIAAALVLEHVPQAIAILLRPGALNALVDAALDEAASPAPDDFGKPLRCMPYSRLLSVLESGNWRCDYDCGRASSPDLLCTQLRCLSAPSLCEHVWGPCAGSEACHALSAAVQWLPQDLPLSRQGTSTTELFHQPGLNNCVPQQSKVLVDAEHSGTLSSDTESADRAQSAQLESISEQEAHAPHGNGKDNADVQQHAFENGHMAGHDSEQYETLTFHVGGILFLAVFVIKAINRLGSYSNI